MNFKRYATGLVLCLALAMAVPPPLASALTLSELLGSSAQSSYTPVTITSATNKTITITATPLSFASNQWMYQVSWNRAKNAKGSFYVSLKSNNGTKVAAVATADQAGSTTFTALPSTAYRVEFYSQPNGKGSLLVRKYFTALAAEKAVATAAGSNLTGSVSSTSGSGYGNLNTTPPSQSNPPYYGSLSSGGLGAGAEIQSTKFDYLGTRIGDGLGSSGSCNLDTSLITSQQNNDGAFAQAACHNVGKMFLASIDYKETAGKCIHWDWTGKYEMDCKVHTALLGYEPQTLTSVPVNNAFDPVLFNKDYNASCFYAVKHYGNVVDGFWAGCGTHTGIELPSGDQISQSIQNYNPVSSVPSQSNPAWYGVLGGRGAPGSGGSGNGEGLTRFNYLGTKIGDGLGSSGSCGLDTSLMTGSTGYNFDSAFAQAACNNVGKMFLTSIDFKDSAGQCVHWDWTGKYKFDCAQLAYLLGYEPQVLNSVPTQNAFDPVLANKDYNATCFYAVKHYGNVVDGYWAGCGTHTGTDLPSADQLNQSIQKYNPSSSVPSQSNPPYFGTLSGGGLGAGVGEGSTKYNYLGTKVGAGIAGSAYSCNLDPSPLATLAQDSAFVSAACAHAGTSNQTFLASIDYKDSAGKCIHWDWSGKYEMDCKIHAALLGYEPQTLSSVPVNNAFDPVLANKNYNASCFYAVKHANGTTLDGFWAGCGTHTGIDLPSADQLNQSIRNYNPNSSVPTQSNPSYFGTLSGGGLGAGVGIGSTKYDYLGIKVGDGLSSNGTCNLGTSYIQAYQDGQDAAFVKAACSHAGPSTNQGQLFLASIDYKDTAGKCIHWDWSGKYEMDCKIHTALLGYEPQVLSSVPMDAFDPTLANKNFNTSCFYAVNHGGQLDGFWAGCGTHTGTDLPTATQLMSVYDARAARASQ